MARAPLFLRCVSCVPFAHAGAVAGLPLFASALTVETTSGCGIATVEPRYIPGALAHSRTRSVVPSLASLARQAWQPARSRGSTSTLARRSKQHFPKRTFGPLTTRRSPLLSVPGAFKPQRSPAAPGARCCRDVSAAAIGGLANAATAEDLNADAAQALQACPAQEQSHSGKHWQKAAATRRPDYPARQKSQPCVRQRTEERWFGRPDCPMNSAYVPLNSVRSAPTALDVVSGSDSVFAPLRQAVRHALPWLSQARAAQQMGEVDSGSAMDSPCP
jgi:hypothetical protein